MRSLCLAGVILSLSTGLSVAEPLSFNDARKLLPRANAKPVIATFPDVVSAADAAQLTKARQSVEDVLTSLGQAMPAYGAMAISPDEGLFVDWLNGAGGFHSTASARAAAITQCNEAKKDASADCMVIVEVAPKGASETFSLSPEANAVFRKDYRKMDAPKAFATSASTGHFGFDRGDGGRALDACERASDNAGDCKIVVQD